MNLIWSPSIYRQVTLNVDSSSVPPVDDQEGQPSTSLVTSKGPMVYEIQPLRMSVSSICIIGPSELSQEYQEVGEALSEMVNLDEDNEWRIELPVYAIACHIAGKLKEATYPAPRIFNHGPKSVVFNWSRGNDDLYLTISANGISALLSSARSIQRRIDCSFNEFSTPVLLLSSIQTDQWGQAFAQFTAASDPLGVVA